MIVGITRTTGTPGKSSRRRATGVAASTEAIASPRPPSCSRGDLQRRRLDRQQDHGVGALGELGERVDRLAARVARAARPPARSRRRRTASPRARRSASAQPRAKRGGHHSRHLQTRSSYPKSTRGAATGPSRGWREWGGPSPASRQASGGAPPRQDPRRRAGAARRPQDWLKKPFSTSRAFSSAETSTLRGVSRKVFSAIFCIPPSSA